MDEKEEDKSEESFRKHLVFYKKLNKTISDIRDEIQGSGDVKILRHLNERMETTESNVLRETEEILALKQQVIGLESELAELKASLN